MDEWARWLAGGQGGQWLRAFLILLFGWGLARLASGGAARLLGRHAHAQYALIGRRVVFYLVLVLALVSALRQVGFELGVLIGAAGILTVAVGIASQTSASNLISGLFLLAERPFMVGDVIRVGSGTTGEVLSVDLLSVKLRTADNLYVRVPNETLIKSEIANLSHFPIRRIDLTLRVAGREDPVRVRELVLGVVARNPLCLVEPRPGFAVQRFGASGVEMELSVWTRRECADQVRTELQQGIKEAFAGGGVELG